MDREIVTFTWRETGTLSAKIEENKAMNVSFFPSDKVIEEELKKENADEGVRQSC